MLMLPYYRFVLFNLPWLSFLFSPQQRCSKRRQRQSGLHRESATPNISPCLPWSVRTYLSVSVWLYFRKLRLTVLLLLFSEMVSVSMQYRWTRKLQKEHSSTSGGETVKLILWSSCSVQVEHRLTLLILDEWSHKSLEWLDSLPVELINKSDFHYWLSNFG